MKRWTILVIFNSAIFVFLLRVIIKILVTDYFSLDNFSSVTGFSQIVYTILFPNFPLLWDYKINWAVLKLKPLFVTATHKACVLLSFLEQ